VKRQNNIWLVLVLGLAVAACGGGGGSSSSPPTPITIPNTAPTFQSDTSFELLEGTVNVGTIEVSDSNLADTLSLEISGGSDESFFELGACNTSRCSSNSLVFTSKPDFENASDSDGDNRYELTLSAFDGTATTTQDISIVVLDAFEGRVVDAPISGASVFVDLNGNDELDDEEPSGTTDDEGFFAVDTFTLPDTGGAKVISKGGVDTKTGSALPNLALISDVPADITKPANVTPLTTVIASVETAEEKAKVLTAMGIDQSPEELLTTDNWEAAESGDEAAKATQRVNQQVGLLLQTASTVVDDGDEATDVSVAVAESVAETISEAAVSDEGVDLTSSETITTVLTEAVEEVAPEVEVEAEAITAVAESVATVNTVVADPTLDPVSDVASDIIQSAQEDLQTSVAEVVTGEASLEEFESETDTTELFSDVVVTVDALDTDDDGVADALDTDDDGDGVNDAQDAFSKDATETIDSDSDGIGNNADTDDDGDGVADGLDAFPLDAAETLDTDSDAIGNNADTDDDGDSVLDTADAFPLDATETIDTDSDGIGNNADTDDDGDSVLDTADAFPLDATETIDTDSDGIGNNTDSDDDGDGVLDAADAFPLISVVDLLDTDFDGSPDDCGDVCIERGMTADSDDDNDLAPDVLDAFSTNPSEYRDFDGDGIGDNADVDDDNDGFIDADDSHPFDAFPANDDYEILINVDQSSLPSRLLEVTPINRTNPDVSFHESGSLHVFDQSGELNVYTQGEATNYKGDWKVENGRLWEKRIELEGPISSNQTYMGGSVSNTGVIFDYVINANSDGPPVGWSNVNLEHWMSNYLSDICYYTENEILLDGTRVCMTLEEFEAWQYGLLDGAVADQRSAFLSVTKSVTEAFELVERKGSQWVFLRTSTEETRLNKSEYLINPELPVEKNVTREVVYFEDFSETIPFLEQEVIGEWALPSDACFSETEQQGVEEHDDAQSCDMRNYGTSNNSFLQTDIATFFEDATGVTSSTKRSFSWSIQDTGELQLVFPNEGMILKVSKYRHYDQAIAVHVEATKADRSLSAFDIAFRREAGIIDVAGFANLDLVSSDSQPFRKYPHLDYDSSRLSSLNALYYVLNFPSNSGDEAEYFIRFDPNAKDGDSELYQPDSSILGGWSILSGSWRLDDDLARLATCYFDFSPDDEFCDFWLLREFRFLKSTQTRLYVEERGYFINGWELQAQVDEDHSDEHDDEHNEETVGVNFNVERNPSNLFYAFHGFFETGFSTNDLDGDGALNAADFFPFNPSEVADSDGDGFGDNFDVFPLDPTEHQDTDADGIGNYADTDDDGDGIQDDSDAFPLDNSEYLDSDGDGLGDFADLDDNSDGLPDLDSDFDGTGDFSDALPNDPLEVVDTDLDGIGNNADTDDDGDGVSDLEDQLPLIASESLDTDFDGVGNNADVDDDGDGFLDSVEVLQGSDPLLANEFPGSGGYIFVGAGYVYGDASSGKATVPVRRLFGSKGKVSVDYVTEAGRTTVEGIDFTTATGTLTWEDGDTADKTVEVPLDYSVRDGYLVKSLKLNIQSPSGGALLGASRTTIYYRPTHAYVSGDQELVNFPGIIRPLEGDSVFEESDAVNEIRFGRFRASKDFLEEFSVDYQIEGCENQWIGGSTTTTASTDYYSEDSSDSHEDESGEYEETGTTPTLSVAPRSGTLTWAAGDETPKSVKLQIASDASVSPDAETCRGSIRLFNPSNSDAYLFQQVLGIRFEYLDDELPETGRIWKVRHNEHREEGEALANLSLVRRGNVNAEMSALVWADPYPSERWANFIQYPQQGHRGLGYREGPPESWRSGVAGNDYIDAGKQLISWGPGEVQTKSVALSLIDNALDDSDKLVFWNFTHPFGAGTGVSEGLVYVSDSEDRTWALLDSDADGFSNGFDFDIDGDGVYNWLDNDRDGDGVSDYLDAFRNDPAKSADLDFDGIADSQDPDIDGDAIANEQDPFPFSNKDVDYDGDGALNSFDLDDDNDQVLDVVDAFPLDETETIDTDGDGIGENTDDDDADGIANAFDAYPSISIGELLDLDRDGAPGVCDPACLSSGMALDTDDDGDGWPDLLELGYGSDPSSISSVLTFLQKGADIDGENAGDLSGIVSTNSDGSVVAIGATGNDLVAQDAGQVRVFELIGNDWVQRGGSFYGEVAGAGLGESVALNGVGDVLAIGAPGVGELGDQHGSAIIYAWDGTSWSQKGTKVLGSAAGDQNGWHLDLDDQGDTLIVSAIYQDLYASTENATSDSADATTTTGSSDSDTSSDEESNSDNSSETNIVKANAGAVRVYEFDDGDWTQRGATFEGTRYDESFGWRVAISGDGNTVGIASPNHSSTVFQAGQISIFEWDGSAWLAKGQAFNGTNFEDKLSYVDLSQDGNTVSIGSSLVDVFDGVYFLPNAGFVQIFDWDASKWKSVGSPIYGSESEENFGQHSLSADGKMIAVSAPYASPGGFISSGRASVYGLAADQWTKISADVAGESSFNYLYYLSLSRDGSTLVTGARYNADAGAAAGHSRIFKATVDSDRDGFADSQDLFPNDPLEWLDLDSDGIGDNSDSDNDNDGMPDVLDALPFDASEFLDTDKDGIGNNADDDDDGDGVSDANDAFPLDRSEFTDTDNDGIGNTKDQDDDGDGVLDVLDRFPLDATEFEDKDNDGIGDNADTNVGAPRYPTLTGLSVSPTSVDISSGAQLVKVVPSVENAAVINWNESRVTFCKYVATESGTEVTNCSSQNYFTSTGDNAAYLLIAPGEDFDRNGDYHIRDVTLATYNNDYQYVYRYDSQQDLDGDGSIVSSADTVLGLDSLGIPQVSFAVTHPDSDSDGDRDYFDAFPSDASESLDTDGDGVGNNADTDDDGDGYEDSVDAFPLNALEHADSDGDGFGDNFEAAGTDTNAPTVTSFTASTSSVDVSSGGQVVAFTLTASDSSGVNWRNSYIVLTHSSGASPLTKYSYGWSPDVSVSADGNSMTFYVPFLPDDAVGDYTVSTILIYDRLGNLANLVTGNELTVSLVHSDTDGDGVLDYADEAPADSATSVLPKAVAVNLSLDLLPVGGAAQSVEGALDSQLLTGRSPTYSIASEPVMGTVTLTNASSGAFTYSTTQSDAGNDSFTFIVNDGVADSLPQTVSIALRSDPLYQYQWHLDNTGQTAFSDTAGKAGEDLNVDSVIAGKTFGSGVFVTVLDDGLDIAHEDLAENLVENGSWNFLSGTNDPTGYDWNVEGDSHGTSVAGIIGAVGWNDLGVRGVAPKVGLKGINLLSFYTELNELNALGFEKYSSDTDIFNMSFGLDTASSNILPATTEDALWYGAANLRAGKGAIYLQSAGNGFANFPDYFTGQDAVCIDAVKNGLSCQSTAMDPNFVHPAIIGVAALGADGQAASYSTAGAANWISAPGGEYGNNATYSGGGDGEPAVVTVDSSGCQSGYVISGSSYAVNAFDDEGNHSENANCNYTSSFNGTSSSAPMVSGVVALMLEANPLLTWRDVKHVLASTARQVDVDRPPITINEMIVEPAWTTNAAGYAFHNSYGFGAVDAQSAVDAARLYPQGSLGSYFVSRELSSLELDAVFAGLETVEDSLNLVEQGTIESVRVKLYASHMKPSGLSVALVSPSGTRSVLLTPFNGYARWDTSDFIEFSSNAFYGEPMQGDWKLEIKDHYPGNGGVLNRWSIKVYGH
jgi:hypothetical protein